MQKRRGLIFLFIILFFSKIYSIEKIRIGAFENEAPFSFFDETEIARGFSIDIIDYLMKEMEYDYEITKYKERDSIGAFSSDLLNEMFEHADIIITSLYSQEKNEKYSYTISYGEIKYKVISQNYHDSYNLEDIYDKDLIVIRKSEAYNSIIRLGINLFKNLILVPDFETGIKIINEGIGECLLTDEIITSKYSTIIKEKALSILPTDLPANKISIVTNNKNLASSLNRYIIKLKGDQQYLKIHNLWIEDKSSFFKNDTFICFLILFVLLIFIIAIFSMLLKMFIRKATQKNRDYQRKLYENLALLKTIKESIPAGLSIFDKNGNLIDVNQRFFDMLGLEREKFVDLNINIFDIQFIPKHVKDSLKAQKECSYEIHYNELKRKINNDMFTHNSHGEYFEVSCVSFKNQKGEIQGYLSVYHDISQLKQDKRQIKILEDNITLALQSGGLTTWLYDCENDKLKILKGENLYDGEIDGSHFKSQIHPQDREKTWNILMDVALNIRKTANVEFRFKKDNKWGWYLWVMNAVPDKDKAGYVTGVRRDITKEVESSIALREQNRELEKAKHKAEESERLKMAFLANMSHEIRTPLNAIVGFSELIRFTEDEIEKDEYFSIVKINNEILLNIINDILDLSKIEAGSVDLHEDMVNIVEVFNNTYQSFVSRKMTDKILFSKICNLRKCKIIIDYHKFIQVLTNFLSNAIKYTPEGLITAGLEYKENNIRIFIKDTGIGIEESKRSFIFQRFEKLDTFAQGTGLGLAICKALTKELNGKIGYEPNPEGGSIFWASFPCEIIDLEYIESPKNMIETMTIE